MQPKLGIIAGGGTLPARLIEHCRLIRRPHFVVALESHCDPETVVGAPHAWFRIGAAGAILTRFRLEGVTELVMIGAIRRPRLRDLRPDVAGFRILLRIWRRFFNGDDKLLRSVAAILEGEGFRVLGIHQVMDSILAPAGAFGTVQADEGARKDIAEGISAARSLGARDIGQAVIVHDGFILAQETASGTDAMLRQASLHAQVKGGVLVKMRKPQQDSRVDLPSIGPETVRQAAAIGLAGIAVEAGHTLVVDLAELVRSADAANLFVVGIETGER